MKNLPMTRNRRNHERGAVALVIAVMWTALFGMAVMAVDFGYLYTKKRGIQSVTDSALKAAMPVFKTSGRNAAETRAREIARLSGYVADATTTIEFDEPVISEQFKVTVGRTHPTFFGGIFGLGPRAIKASATGKVTAAGGPAIHARDTRACGAQWDWGTGIEVTGGGFFTVNGDVTSVNKIHIGNPNALCNGVNCRITGAVQTPCTFWNDSGSAVMGAPAATGGVPPDPLAANTLATLGAACTGGTSIATPMAPLTWIAGPCPGGMSLATGVYCSSTDIIVTPAPFTTICPTTASFISAGTVMIQTDGGITLTAAPGTNGIIAFSNAGLGGPAIHLSNGVTTQYTLNGSVYAPNGLVQAGTGAPGFTMTGILDGFAVVISMGPTDPWTFNAPAGGGGPGWTMLN
jgi:hypothetical protein